MVGGLLPEVATTVAMLLPGTGKLRYLYFAGIIL